MKARSIKKIYLKIGILTMLFFILGFLNLNFANGQTQYQQIIGFNFTATSSDVFGQFGAILNNNLITQDVSGVIDSVEFNAIYSQGTGFGVDDNVPHFLQIRDSILGDLDCRSQSYTPQQLGLQFQQTPNISLSKSVVFKNFVGEDCNSENWINETILEMRKQSFTFSEIFSVGIDENGFSFDFYVYNSNISSLFNDNSRIIGNYIPQLSAVFSNDPQTVNFSFDYFSGFPTLQTVGVEIQNIGIGLNLIPLQQQVLQNGTLTFSTSTSLSSGVYQWRAFIRNETFQDYSGWRLFTIGTTSQQSIVPVPDGVGFECNTENWLTDSLCTLFGFLFIPNPQVLNRVFDLYTQLQTVKPFGYIIQVIQLRGSMQLSTQTVFFETSALKNLVFDPIRNGLIAILWVLFLFYLYNRFKKFDF